MLWRNSALLLLLLIFSGSCTKEKITLTWVQQDSQTSSELNSVFFLDENRGFATGGDSWFRGVAASTTDGGTTWSTDSIGGKQIFGLHFNEIETGRAVGHDGLMYVKEKKEENWRTLRLARWDSHRDVAFYGDEGLIVSGAAYQNGVLQKVYANYSTEVIDTFENELNSVCYSDRQTAHIVGYGMILRSTDGGETWERSPQEGDFFRDVYFPTADVGYIVGFSGSILKSTDGGASWEWLRRGDALLVKNKAFRAVHFADELRGYIVGEQGLFWRTHDGGESWQVDKGFPEVDFFDVFATESGGFVVGAAGQIIKFADPQ